MAEEGLQIKDDFDPELRIREKHQEKLDAFNEAFCAETGMKLAYVSINFIREQDVNARKMSPEHMVRLMENIKKVGAMESVPFCCKNEHGYYQLISGHNRYRAARDSGLKYLLVMFVEGLTIHEQRAKQIAHNSLQGVDNFSILDQMAKDLNTVELQFESGMDLLKRTDDEINLESLLVDIGANADTLNAVTIIFSNGQFEKVQMAATMIEEILKAKKPEDGAFLEHAEGLKLFRKACYEISDKMNIRNMPMIMTKMAQLAISQMEAEGASKSADSPTAVG